MTNEIWYDHFMDILSEKYSTKAKLAQALMDLLCMEREAVYRRLRRDVIFPAHEIVKIASSLNISLDEVIGVKSQKILFQMQPLNYTNPSKEDMNFVRKRVQVLEQLKDVTGSEYMVVCNHLSRSLSSGFEILYRFLIFRWSYE